MSVLGRGGLHHALLLLTVGLTLHVALLHVRPNKVVVTVTVTAKAQRGIWSQLLLCTQQLPAAIRRFKLTERSS